VVIKVEWMKLDSEERGLKLIIEELCVDVAGCGKIKKAWE
jgi:hypothetical protein